MRPRLTDFAEYLEELNRVPSIEASEPELVIAGGTSWPLKSCSPPPSSVTPTARSSSPPPQPICPACWRTSTQTFPALSTQIKDEQGKLRRFINIYINDEDIRFLGGDAYAFQEGDEIMLIPSIAGGRC